MLKPRRRTEKSARQVEELAGLGLSRTAIARVVGVPRGVLVKLYHRELDRGIEAANAAVAKTLFAKATNPRAVSQSVTAAIFWLKCRANWREPAAVHEIGGLAGGPVKVLLKLHHVPATGKREAP